MEQLGRCCRCFRDDFITLPVWGSSGLGWGAAPPGAWAPIRINASSWTIQSFCTRSIGDLQNTKLSRRRNVAVSRFGVRIYGVWSDRSVAVKSRGLNKIGENNRGIVFFCVIIFCVAFEEFEFKLIDCVLCIRVKVDPASSTLILFMENLTFQEENLSHIIHFM